MGHLVEFEHLDASAQRNAWSLADIPWSDGLDHAQLWFPESMSPLYYTQSYASLLPEERVRYNHLFAMSVSEQFIFLEQTVLNAISKTLLERSSGLPQGFRVQLERFVEEEDKHTEAFWRLLEIADPEAYGERRHQLLTPGRLGAWFMGACARHPDWIVGWPFLAMALEEKTVTFYRAYQQVADPSELCPLHHEVHRLHMLDEVRHIHLDALLVEEFWRKAPSWLRWINGLVIARTLGQFTAPRRKLSANMNVVRKLVGEFPRLGDQHEQMRAQLRGLKNVGAYQSALHGPGALPKTHRAFRQEPELARFAHRVPGFALPPGAQ